MAETIRGHDLSNSKPDEPARVPLDRLDAIDNCVNSSAAPRQRRCQHASGLGFTCSCVRCLHLPVSEMRAG